MRKAMYLLLVLLMTSVVSAQQASLKVDFGNSGSPLENGYEVYAAGHEVEADFVTQSYEVFDVTVGVTPSWADDAVPAVMQMIDRGANQNDYGLVGGVINPDDKDDLMRDWIGSDTRSAGDPLTLTISGLPAGLYDWVSYHNDTGTGSPIGIFDVTVNDASGSVTTLDVQGSSSGFDGITSIDGVTKFSVQIISNGADDVSLVFDNQPWTSEWNWAWVAINGFELTQLYVKGAATDPVPFSNEVDSETIDQISWSAPVDDDIDFIDGYDVYFGTIPEPNIVDNPMIHTTDTFMPVDLDYGTTYYWRVDTHVTWLDASSEVVEGLAWQFTTLPDDKTPIVTADDAKVITSMEFLPVALSGTVDDWGEGDIVDVSWTVSVDLLNEAMQMITRTGQTEMDNLAEITDDPNLLMDWIGTDTRENKVFGNPMSLTLKGLPAATYTWKSYHHDAESLAGVFDVTVIDANGSTVIPDNQGTSANTQPISVFEIPITSNGDDVTLIFELQVPEFKNTANEFFVMNGFELTDGGASPLMIDFDDIIIETDEDTGDEIEIINTMPGYERYAADHEVADTFTEQSYGAFGTTVSILPGWNGLPVLTDTVNDPASAVQAATMASKWPGTVTVNLTATDNSGQSGSADIAVDIAANACEGAQLDTASWNGFNITDFNSDCMVDVEDLAAFAAGWLDDRNLSGQK